MPATVAASKPTHTTIPPVRPRIVVGVDGSDQSVEALKWAAELAASAGADLETVGVYSLALPIGWTGLGSVAGVPDIDPAELADAARCRLDQAIEAAGARGRVARSSIVASSSASDALANAASGATMLVVGAHRRHWLDGSLGSTAHACLRQAPCAIVVVPSRTQNDDASHRPQGES